MTYLKISVITPSFNQEPYLEENIRAVLHQNYPNLEHIVMDGGSTDGSIDILHKYPHLIWRSEKDRGQTHALNKAVAISSGEIICWLNSDDMLCDGALDIVNNYFVDNPDRYMLTGNLLYVDKAGKLLKKDLAGKLDRERLLNGTQCILQPATFFKKCIFEKTGQFDETYHYCMDHDFFIRALNYFESFTINADLAMFRIHGASKTTTQTLGILRDVIRYKVKHNAKIFSEGNKVLLYSFIALPFKRIRSLRRFVRRLKGEQSDWIN